MMKCAILVVVQIKTYQNLSRAHPNQTALLLYTSDVHLYSAFKCAAICFPSIHYFQRCFSSRHYSIYKFSRKKNVDKKLL